MFAPNISLLIFAVLGVVWKLSYGQCHQRLTIILYLKKNKKKKHFLNEGKLS